MSLVRPKKPGHPNEPDRSGQAEQPADYWQLGEGQYWGHNTIIRTAPFMEHCALPRLPGDPPLGGEILSHDFVEAALMGRAGWALWLAYDLPGSWEEVPTSLLEEMKRDRRWCQGNIQHLRLLATEGLYGAHRALFVNGVLGYVSAMLWFAFLLLSTGAAIYESVREPVYFPEGRSLFPQWPVWRPDWAIALAGVTPTTHQETSHGARPRPSPVLLGGAGGSA